MNPGLMSREIEQHMQASSFGLKLFREAALSRISLTHHYCTGRSHRTKMNLMGSSQPILSTSGTVRTTSLCTPRASLLFDARSMVQEALECVQKKTPSLPFPFPRFSFCARKLLSYSSESRSVAGNIFEICYELFFSAQLEYEINAACFWI